MLDREKYGRRILNSCLPPVKYKVMGLGRISLTDLTSRGSIHITAGNFSQYAEDFRIFLHNNGVLKLFIECAFSNRAICGTVLDNRGISSYEWLSKAFMWSYHRYPDVSWEELSREWANSR